MHFTNLRRCFPNVPLMTDFTSDSEIKQMTDVGRGIIDFSPADGAQSYWREKSRDRVLNDPELAVVIRAAPEIRAPYGGIVELLALTGQRREEVAQMTWDEVDLGSHDAGKLLPRRRSYRPDG
jgi:integrase